MARVVDLTYIEKTESYIEQNKESIPKTVYTFIKDVCADERKYHDLIHSMAQEKKVFKA
jgi:hypothetical protein